MSIKIRRDPFHPTEKFYRATSVAAFALALATALSAAVIVPLFASENSFWVMILYGVLFFLYCLGLLTAAAAGFISAAKAKNELLYVHGAMQLAAFAMAAANSKLFAVILLYGLKFDRLAEKITGSDTDAFVEKSVKSWAYLIIALVVSGILCVLSLIKLVRERSSD